MGIVGGEGECGEGRRGWGGEEALEANNCILYKGEHNGQLGDLRDCTCTWTDYGERMGNDGAWQGLYHTLACQNQLKKECIDSHEYQVREEVLQLVVEV